MHFREARRSVAVLAAHDHAAPAATNASDQTLHADPRPDPPDRELPTGDDAIAGEDFADGEVEHPGASGLWALFLGLGLMMTGNGLNGSLVGLRAGAEGFSLVVTGIVMAGYFAGFLLGPWAVVQMIPKVGHIRVFAGLASTASTAVLVFTLAVDPALWAAMRFTFGFCMAGLYVVIESWLNAMASTSNRGRTLAVYMLVTMGGMILGQVLLGVGDVDGHQLFVLASVLVSLSLVPVTLAATTAAPEIRFPVHTSVREMIGYIPTGVLGSFMTGASAGVLLGLGAVYANAIDLSIQRTAGFLAAPLVGAIIFQWPVGWVSDRISRRFVIFVVANVAGASATSLVFVPAHNPAVVALMVLLGGAVYSLYSLVVAYTLDWTPQERTVSASGTLVRINGSGAIFGPLVGAAMMAAFGADMFFWTIVGAQAVLVSYLGWRLLFKDPLPLEEQRLFVIIPARATEAVFRLLPGTRDRDEPSPT